MTDFFLRLWDTDGFVPRRGCGEWTPGHSWLHIGSDLFIFAAYISIPLILLWHIRRWNSSPIRWVGGLFASFIIFCGFTHLLDAILFYHPVYRLAGLLKFLTAIVSWATVFVLIPVAPRILQSLQPADGQSRSSPDLLIDITTPDRPFWMRYGIALLATLTALLLRALLDPLVGENPIFVLSLLGILYTGWVAGLGPAILSLLLTFLGTVYFFIEPRGTLIVEGIQNQFALLMFFFSGMMCAFLSASEYTARRQLADSLKVTIDRQKALEQEMGRRFQAEEEIRRNAVQLAASQQATVEALRRFQTLAEAMPQMVWVVDPTGKPLYYNSRWVEYTGLTNEALLEDHWLKALHPNFHDELRARWAESIRTHAVFEIEYLLRNTQGDYRWFLARATPSYDSSGNIDRWFGTCTDIHDTRALQESLRTSSERFQTLTETMPNLVWTADAQGRLNYSNRRWLEVTGLVPGDEDEGNARLILHPEDGDRVHEGWMHAVRTEQPIYREEFRLRHRDGSYQWYSSTARPIRDSEQRIIEWVGALNNIHDQKNREEWLEQEVAERTAALRQEVEERTRAESRAQAMTVELQRSNKELEAFASVASHDLQEPLRKILAFGERLAKQYREQLAETGRDYLDRIMNAATRMRRLIEDLLTYSRVTTRIRPFSSTDLTQVVREVIIDLEISISNTEAKLEIDPLPRIDADAGQMRQMFQNLLANAIKFTKPETPPNVRVFTRPAPEGCVQIAVRDEGIGFDPRYQDRIFQIFQRLHGRQEYEGTGIGLAICKKIVDRHGGSIMVETTPGEGATFVVTLPCRQISQEDR